VKLQEQVKSTNARKTAIQKKEASMIDPSRKVKSKRGFEETDSSGEGSNYTDQGNIPIAKPGGVIRKQNNGESSSSLSEDD
jgi:hypothetical protein